MEKNNRGVKKIIGMWCDCDDNWIWDIEENWNVEENVQTDRGKNGVETSTELNEASTELNEPNEIPKEKLYKIETVNKEHSKKFKMTATDYNIQFIDPDTETDPLQIFEHILKDVKENMKENDHIRFTLKTKQLDNPIALPYMRVHQLTPERIFSKIERTLHRKQEFLLDGIVRVKISHVEHR